MAVPLLPDELFSSWLARFALTRGCDPLSLTGSLWRGERLWTRDPDRGLPDERLMALSARMGVDADALRNAFLPSRVPVSHVDFRRPVWPWVLPVGARNRLRHGGLQFCPQCLGADRAPYYRVRWRLAWNTCCAEHAALLLDRCLNCQAPAEPHRLTATDENLAICATCKVSLATPVGNAAPAGALSFQESAYQVEATGHGNFGALRLSREDWFALARFLSVLLRRASTGKPGWSINRFLAQLDLDDARAYRTRTGLSLELLSTEDRSTLLGGVACLIAAGVNRFAEAALHAGVTRRSFRMMSSYLPAAVESRIPVTSESDAKARRSIPARRPMKPKSPASVAQSWARLCRRITAELR